MLGIITVVVILASISSNLVSCVFFTTQCPTSCICDFTDQILTISCSQYNAAFRLPYVQPDLTLTQSVISKFNYLRQIPTSACQFNSSLRILDLSSNEIADNITFNSFNCLFKLEFLNVSRNSIRALDENAFILTGSLSVLDLSYNQISFLPSNLFTGNRTQNLKYLFLNNNLLTDIDVWFFYLNSIIKIDLSSNFISRFTNRIGYKPSIKTSNQLPNATLIDLRFNSLTKFDDSILATYSLCSASDLGYFFHLLNVMRIDSNFFDCSCSSYRMLMFYQTLKTASSITPSSNIFLAKCSKPLNYSGLSIFEFMNPNMCVGFSPLVDNCVSSTTSFTTTATVSVQNPNNPELLVGLLRNQTYVTSELTDGQIAGIVVGFFGAAVLLVILLYCVCPVEILACLFGVCPSFYRVCPCKSGVLSNKYYDVFISYNKSSESWINDKLVPFLRKNRPNDRYFLQYDKTNVNQEKFGSFTRGKMDNSAVLLLVLSDKYLMKEWQVAEFRNHVRHLVTRRPRENDKSDRTRLICVQMHDVCDEEVDDYVRNQLQIPRFISLENDEFYFWHKLDYFLHSNKEKDPVIVPVNITEPIITVTSDESPRSEPSMDQIQRDNYLLDEYSTSLEHIIYEKIPSLSVRNETIQDIRYDHTNKKFTYVTKKEFEEQVQDQEAEPEPTQENEAEDEIEEKPKRKHKKHHRHKKHRKSSNRNDESVAMDDSYEGASEPKVVKFKTSSKTPIYF